MITVEESGMTFGPFSKNHFFHIEKSSVYLEIQNHVKMIEFIWHKHDESGGQIWLVEAKKSSPHPGNRDDWENYLGELKEKFENGLSLFIALCLKRHTDSELHETIRAIDLEYIPFKLTLVLKGYKSEWVPPLKDALQQKLLPMCKSLNLILNPILVLNDEMALTIGLIT
jgi:hypothetical protein